MDMTKPYNLPARYEGRRDVPYVIRGRKLSDMEPLAQEITARIAEGESLRAICKRPGMPSAGVVIAWAVADPAFGRRYALAREAQAEGFAQELAELADAAVGLDNAGVQAQRLRVDTRKWIAARILPKQYGDRVDVAHSGALSVAAASAALRTVRPPTFDQDGNEVEDADLVHDAPRPARASDAASAGHEASGTLLAGVSTNGGREGSLAEGSEGVPPGVCPGKGTPNRHPAPVTPNPKIPNFLPNSPQLPTDSRQPALSDLL